MAHDQKKQPGPDSLRRAVVGGVEQGTSATTERTHAKISAFISSGTTVVARKLTPATGIEDIARFCDNANPNQEWSRAGCLYCLPRGAQTERTSWEFRLRLQHATTYGHNAARSTNLERNIPKDLLAYKTTARKPRKA